MKNAFLSLLLAGGVVPTWLPGQTVASPPIEWQRSFGGTNWEAVSCVRIVGQSGFVVGGYSESPAGGNKTSPSFGRGDYWVVRLDNDGHKLWEQSYGGTELDYLTDLIVMPDGGFLLGGFSESGASGNKTSPGFGMRDYWIIRVSEDGNKLWERSYGTTNVESMISMQFLPDGGFVLSGNLLYPSIPSDWWVVRIDSIGNVVWERTLGGNAHDQSPFVRAMSNGHLCLAGSSESPISGDKTSGGALAGPDDFWLVRLDQNGMKLWDRSYGGNSFDYLFALAATSDGGLLLGGASDSEPSGNKTSAFFGAYYNFGDFWVVRVDGEGDKVWEKSLGGSSTEIPGDAIQTSDEGFLVGGSSASSPSGNKTTPFYGGGFKGDYWLVRLDAGGEKVWEQSYGGSEDDNVNGLAQTADGGMIIAGTSASQADGNKTAPTFGRSDFWIVKLAPDVLHARPRLRALAQSAAQIRDLGYRMMLQGLPNRSYGIEFSTNLTNWSVLLTNRLEGTNGEVVALQATNAPAGFYRARLLPDEPNTER